MTDNTLHTITGEYQTHTNAAICIRIDDSDHWFPLRCIECDQPLISFTRGQTIELNVQEWLLERNGLDWMIDA